MGRAKRWLYPDHWVYVLVHAVLFLGGIILVVTHSGTSILSAIGVSLIAAGVAGWVVFVYVLVSQNVNRKLELITEFGFVNAFEARSVRIKDEYDKRIKKAHNIDIIGFGLRALRQDYRDQFANWKQHAKVRILLLDPDFPSERNSYSKERDTEENNSIGTIKTDVSEFILACKDLLDDSNFQVHRYRCLPSINIFRVDDELFWGPYLIKQESRNSPTFLVKRGGILFDRLLKHFEEIWNDKNLSVAIKSEELKSSK